MFTIRFDFDLEEYKKNFKMYEALKTKPLGFTEPVRNQITEACTVLARLAALVIQPGKLRDRLLREYFCTDTDPSLLACLAFMNNVVSDQTLTVTFVDGSKRHVSVKVNPHDLDEEPVLMATPYDDAVMDTAGAWAHVLPGSGKPNQPQPRKPGFGTDKGGSGYHEGDYHVGSGIRIILGRHFGTRADDTLADKYDKAGTIYHELTHKILGTNDHEYGDQGSKTLAQLSRDKAMKNADNYCCFLAAFGRQYDVGIRN